MAARQAPIPGHDRDSPKKNKRPRNFIKCAPCRRARKPCDLDELAPLETRCSRCVRSGKMCGKRGRAQKIHRTLDMLTQERANIFATRCLLRFSLQANRRLKSSVYPWPCCGLHNQKAFACLFKSSSLREDFSPTAMRLKMQIEALNDILDQLSQHEIETQAEVEMAQRARQNLDGGDTSTTLACVAHVREGHNNEMSGRLGAFPSPSPSSSPAPASSSPTFEHYISLSRSIQEILSTRLSGAGGISSSGNGAFVSVNDGFPPIHIAYLNGNKRMAVDQWCQAVGTSDDQVTDLLGRTLPELAAEYGDFATLREIFKHAEQVMLRENHTGRDICLLALSVCAPGQPDFEFLSLLLSRLPHVVSQHAKPGPSILDLALLLRNKDIIELILEENIDVQSFERYVQKAIELGEANMALVFVDFLAEKERHSQGAIDRLAEAAKQTQITLTDMLNSDMGTAPGVRNEICRRQRDFRGLVKALKEVRVQAATAQQIEASIRQVAFR